MGRQNKAFTLIEIAVVVAVMGILAAAALTGFNPLETTRRSRDSRRVSDLATLRRAIDLSLSDGGILPVVTAANLSASTSVTEFPVVGGLDISRYLAVVPQDPAYNPAGGSLKLAKGDCSQETGFKDAMTYTFKSDGVVYVLKTRLESVGNCGLLANDGAADDFYAVGTDPGL